MAGKSAPAYTSAKDWRKAREEGIIFHFPSGMKAVVRPVNVGTFIKLGNIPDILSAVVQKLISQEPDMANTSLEEMSKMQEVYDIFCKTCFVMPRVVDTIKDPDTEILAEDISDVDKQTLFQFLGAPASTLASFRYLPQNVVADLVGSQSDPKSA